MSLCVTVCHCVPLGVSVWSPTSLTSPSRSRTPSDQRAGLVELDEWYSSTLPAAIAARKPMYITQAELSRVMKWKLTREKFRPRLQQFVDALEDADVQRASTLAFRHCGAGRVRQAVAALTVLKGIGPATASAVLSAGCPSVPFLSELPSKLVLGTPRLAYSVEELLTVRSLLAECADALNAGEAADCTGWCAGCPRMVVPLHPPQMLCCCATPQAVWNHHTLDAAACATGFVVNLQSAAFSKENAPR